MSFSSENLLRELNQKKIIDWTLELKNGKEAYLFLFGALREKQLNVNQSRNALHALWKIRNHGSSEEVLQMLVDCSQDPNKAVRSEAVQLAIGLVKLSRLSAMGNPIALSDEQSRALNDARALGLTHKVNALVSDFFNQT